jgi:hypothetical protein
VENYGCDLIERAYHNMVFVNGEIYIFGGKHEEGYLNFDPVVVRQGKVVIVR